MKREEAKQALKEVFDYLSDTSGEYTVRFTKLREDRYENSIPSGATNIAKFSSKKVIDIQYTSALLSAPKTQVYYVLMHELAHVLMLEPPIWEKTLDKLMPDAEKVLAVIYYILADKTDEVVSKIEYACTKMETMGCEVEDLMPLRDLKDEINEALAKDELKDNWYIEVVADCVAFLIMTKILGVTSKRAINAIDKLLQFEGDVENTRLSMREVRASIKFGDADHPPSDLRVDMIRLILEGSNSHGKDGSC